MKKVFAVGFLLAFSLGAFAQEMPKSHWAEFDKNKIHYYDIGNAKKTDALVFIHGWTGNTEIWNRSYNMFPQHRVIVIDLIGHGKSDKPKVTYSMDYFAKSVEAVLKKAKVKKAVLVGHSMGTPVARQVYRLYPNRVAGIVIVDGGLRPFGTKAESEQFIAPMRKDYKAVSVQFIDAMMQTIKDDALKQQVRNSTIATPEHVGLSAMEGFGEEKLWLTDPINVPVLAVLAESRFWKPDNEKFFRSLIPNIEYQMWPGVTHFLMMERPAEFNDAITAFIRKNGLLGMRAQPSPIMVLTPEPPKKPGY